MYLLRPGDGNVEIPAVDKSTLATCANFGAFARVLHWMCEPGESTTMAYGGCAAALAVHFASCDLDIRSAGPTSMRRVRKYKLWRGALKCDIYCFRNRGLYLEFGRVFPNRVELRALAAYYRKRYAYRRPRPFYFCVITPIIEARVCANGDILCVGMGGEGLY